MSRLLVSRSSLPEIEVPGTPAPAPYQEGPAATELRGLLALFGDEQDLDRFDPVAAEAVPSPYDRLLVHDQHMTVALEAYHGAPLILVLHGVARRGEAYARKITLHTQPGGPAVLLGIMRFNLRYCAAGTREAILSARTPLGRILVEHDVLRTLIPGPYFRVRPRGEGLLSVPVRLPPDCHGRLARIECNGARAVEVLEIITAL